MLPRGGGTSQCGQTVGAALVVDCSKHLRRVLDVDVANRTAVVEPGLVLDHLNAQLKPHGLWYPGRRVDERAGDARRHGRQQLVRLALDRVRQHGPQRRRPVGAGCPTARRVDLGPLATLGAKERAIADFVRDLAHSLHDEIVARWPKVLRRVAGYNLDIFEPQSEKPYTRDGSVNLAHLLVGAEGTLAFTRSLTLQAIASCRARRCSASSTSRPSTRRWTPRSTSSSSARRRSSSSIAR